MGETIKTVFVSLYEGLSIALKHKQRSRHCKQNILKREKGPIPVPTDAIF